MKMDIETVATELKLDRSNWSLVKFGDVAIQQKESVDRENTEITRYVKGEHMYSEDLHLREWASLKMNILGQPLSENLMRETSCTGLEELI